MAEQYTILPMGGYRRESDGAIIPVSAPGNTDWEQLQTWLKAGNKAVDPPENFEFLKTQKHTQNEAEAARRLQLLVARYPQEERESWWLLTKDVEAFLDDLDLGKYPALRIEAIARSGVTDESKIQDIALALAETVIRKRDALHLATSQIRGVRSRIADEIDAATTVKAVNAIRVLTRWEALMGSQS